MPSSHRRLAGFTLLAGALLLLPACSGEDPKPQPIAFQATVRGKVTYQGQPVPYGYVLFYSHDKSFDPKSATFAPSVVAPIQADGTYQMTDAALGPVMVCVAADPEADLVSLMRPTSVGPPMPGDGPPMGPPGVPPIGPPGAPPVGPPMGLPGPPPAAPAGAMPNPANPQLEKLTAEQKKMLKEIHARYGEVGKSSLNYAVREGEQTFDIKLK